MAWTVPGRADTMSQDGGDLAAPPAAPAPRQGGGDESALQELEQALQRPASVSVAGPVVTSASRREEKAVAAPSTVIIIDKNEIRLRGYSQLTDVLRDLPGMETIGNYFSEFGTQVPVRGISGNNKIVVLINGMRVNPPGGENFPFRSDFSVRFAERVEVVYGSGSTLYGQDAISMVVNVVTRTPGGSGDGKSNGGENPAEQGMSAGGFSNNVEMGVQGGTNFEREAWGWYGGVMDCCRDLKVTGYIQYHDSDLTSLDREYPTYWQPYKTIAQQMTNANGAGVVPIRGDYGLNLFGRVEGENTSLQIWHRESERSSGEGSYFTAQGQPILAYLPKARWADSSTVIEGKNTLRLNDDVTLESMTNYNVFEINPISLYIWPASATDWSLNDDKYGRGTRLSQEEILKMEFSERFSVLAGGIVSYSDIIPKSTINGGYDPARDPVDQGRFFHYSTTDLGPHTNNINSLNKVPQVSEVTYWTYAAYVEGQWQISDQLKLVTGVRVTKDDHYQEVPITPRASLIYAATENTTIKYMYTDAFVAPAPYFAYATYDNGSLLATTNASVAPETAQTHELNLAYNYEKLSLGLSTYYGTQGSLILVSDQGQPQNVIIDPVTHKSDVFLYDDQGNFQGKRTLVQTANGGQSVRCGTDFYGKYTGECLSPWWSYSYVDFRQTNNGVTTGLPGISRHNGRLGVTWRAADRLFITPSLVIRSTPENINAGLLGGELDTPWELDLFIMYKRCEHMDFFVDLRNVTDHHYALGGISGYAVPQETFHGVAGIRLAY